VDAAVFVATQVRGQHLLSFAGIKQILSGRNRMDKLTIGILAHVDAGKTTLSEAMLYRTGKLRRLGRVDHRDAFLDTDVQERERGITIFSKQALLTAGDLSLTLLDTPGHADFSAETERTLRVLDAAILVISAPDGVQGHTMTLAKLLERLKIPTFFFLNKMDQPGVTKASALEKLKPLLGKTAAVDFSQMGTAEFWETAALGDEDALNEYLEHSTLSDETLRRLIQQRKLFPLFWGSALKVEGVDALLDGLARFAPRPKWKKAFAARVYKISRDSQGVRLTHIKLTGGSLRVKEAIHEEKVNQIRLYSGAKFTVVEQVEAGTVCALTGLSTTFPGQSLGEEPPWIGTSLEPALSYQILLPDGCDPHTAIPKLTQLTEEDPQLHLEWNERLREVRVRLMGTVQAEVLQRLILERFHWKVTFGPGSILYRETIAAPVEGVGHFEPLRHYAEVHLLLEPLPQGSGLQFSTACPENDLDRNWQRLILTHLMEKTHLGVLTGSPVTDLRITLLSGRAHEKHTEGGDFRQATYRAVRQGLMSAKSVLLEPWYVFRLTVPTPLAGRAIHDIQRMGGESEDPEISGEETTLTGQAPVAGLRDYAREVTAYTKGRGRLACESGPWRPCPEQETIVAELGYHPERDVENPASSIFCSHGAGHEISWEQVPQYAHLPMSQRWKTPDEPVQQSAVRIPSPVGGLEQDKELLSIFERTYGTVRPRGFQPVPKGKSSSTEAPERAAPGTADIPAGPEYLLVDGYNMIFAWEDLQALARENLDAARKTLMDLLSNYQGFRKNRVILVFDAYKVPQGTGSVIKYHNIHVVYTKEAETADTYIEKASYQLTQERKRVRVATSDAAEQFIILGHGALRMSAQELREELSRTAGEIGAILQKNNLHLPTAPMRQAFEKAKAERPTLRRKRHD